MDDPHHLEKQAGTLAGEPGALACYAQILARKPAHHDVGLARLRVVAAHVVMARRVRPVFRQHLPALRIDFHLRDHRAAGALESEIEATDTGEK